MFGDEAHHWIIIVISVVNFGEDITYLYELFKYRVMHSHNGKDKELFRD